MTRQELEALVASLSSKVATLEAEASKPTTRQTSGRRGAVIGLGLVFGTGEPRMQFQDRLFIQNTEGWTSVGPDGERKTVHLTDQELLVLNHVEHPTCTGTMNLRIVRVMRDLFNEGRHSRLQTTPPVVPSCEFDLAGTPVGRWAEITKRTLALAKAS